MKDEKIEKFNYYELPNDLKDFGFFARARSDEVFVIIGTHKKRYTQSNGRISVRQTNLYRIDQEKINKKIKRLCKLQESK